MKKLAIVGSHPDTRDNAPFDDPDYDIMVFNESAMFPWCKRWDHLLQIHKPEVYQSTTKWVKNGHGEWLQKDHGERTIWMQNADKQVPNSKRYPLDEIVATIPGGQLRFVGSSPSYALALAIYLGYKDVDLYGMYMSSNSEYGYQIPNYLFWVGVAFGFGINLGINSGLQHFKEKLYGYEGEIQIDRSHFEKRANELEKFFRKEESDLIKIKDRVSNYMLKQQHDKVLDYTIKMKDKALDAGRLSGAKAESDNYAKRTDPIARFEFERRAAGAQKDGEGYIQLTYHATGKFEYVWNIWKQTNSYEALKQCRIFFDEILKYAFDAGARNGIYKENIEYINEYDELMQAAGGVRTMSALEGKNDNN